jgi:polysaccharide deacetylase 2 family uncharacterized protein YibQ
MKSEPRPRRAGRFLALLAGLILIGSAGGTVWLHQTQKLQDLAEQPPTITVQIPDEAVKPAEAASEATPPAGESTASAATIESAPAATSDGSSAAMPTPPAPATTETLASTETVPPSPAETTAATATAAAESSSAATTTTEAPAVTEAIAVPPAAPSTVDMAAATEAPAATETPVATVEPSAPAAVEATAIPEPTAPATVDAGAVEATAPPPPTAIAESDAAGETAVPLPAIPLPRLKPPPPAAPAPTLTAMAETTAPAAPAAAGTTAEATPPAPATASPGASLGSAATALAVTAPAASETTQTASAAAPAASSGGEPSWKKNARPFAADDPRPRVSLVITGLGLTAAQTQAAIDQLPPEITLGFSPYSGELQNWVAKARAAGHEVLIELPMEPLNYPADDPGPQALLAKLSPAENLQRLDWVLARSDQMVGLIANMGSRFQANARLIRPILTRVAEKGYLYVDNRSGPTSVVSEVAASIDLPWTYNTRFVDAEATRVSIDGRLQQLERTAREKGFALGLAQGYPVTMERVAAWAKSLEVKGLALAPASALVKTGTQ